MELFETIVAEFGVRIGIAGLKPNANDIVDLAFERLGRVQMQASGDDVFITLARELPPHSRHHPAALLKIGHWRENHRWELHPGLKGETLATLTARAPLRELDVPALEQLVASLARLMDTVEEAG